MPTTPHHLAIIMDGNRRWAQQRSVPVLRGHQQGSNTLKTIARHSHDRGIRWLSAFAFSNENWSRPRPEVDGLMGLLRGFLENDISELNDENVKLRVIGNRSRLSNHLGKLIDWAEQETAGNTGLNLTLALDFGGRQDIAIAARSLATEVASGLLDASAIDEDMLKSRMAASPLPEIDMLIRTGGEQRLSNFMLWDLSYAELYFTSSLWPDFTTDDLDRAIQDFAGRERRFGGDANVRIVESVTSLADRRRSV
ncbi:MAG: polyprenyl diphosphate synthase [Candidatus Puniceispirillaceae bacterium]